MNRMNKILETLNYVKINDVLTVSALHLVKLLWTPTWEIHSASSDDVKDVLQVSFVPEW